MTTSEKVCLVVFRTIENCIEILGFQHPYAGKQFVKGTVETDELLLHAAKRELHEESGLDLPGPFELIGAACIGENRQSWHFFRCASLGLPETWQHVTDDDYGHTFQFFWHPIDKPLDDEWHPQFHAAFDFIKRHLI